MAKQIHFFALKEDLLPVIEMFESGGPVKYVRTGHYSQPICETIEHAAHIPNLGRATHESASGCESFLVSDRDTLVRLQSYKLNTGQQQFAMDQLVNPDTIVFTAGGVWNEDVLLNGKVGTVSVTKPAQDLMKRFQRAIKKNFTKIKAFYVGPKAEELLDRGVRLTIAEQSAREFDLRR